jgi:hypothetical protein
MHEEKRNTAVIRISDLIGIGGLFYLIKNFANKESENEPCTKTNSNDQGRIGFKGVIQMIDIHRIGF